MRCLGFHLGEGQYALPLHDLVEVLPLLPMREIPHAPDSIRGMIDYRRRVVPVLDLCRLALGRPCAERMSTRLLVLRRALAGKPERLLAVMVERAVSVVQLDPVTLNPPPVRIGQTPYLRGLATNTVDLVQLVDPARILPSEIDALLYPDERA